MKNKSIIFGTILATFLLFIMPIIPASQHQLINEAVEEKIEYIRENISNLFDLNKFIRGFLFGTYIFGFLLSLFLTHTYLLEFIPFYPILLPLFTFMLSIIWPILIPILLLFEVEPFLIAIALYYLLILSSIIIFLSLLISILLKLLRI